MPYAVILFDFFGTLVEYQPDRTRLGYPASHQLVSAWGADLTATEFVREFDAASAHLEHLTRDTHVEFSMLESALAFAARIGLPISDAQCRELGAMFLGEWRAHVTAVAGVAEMTERLTADHRLGIVSNTHDESMIPEMLEAMGIARHFETLILSVEHGVRKPHHSIYRAALDAMECGPDDVAFVGDSFDADYLGPTDAGMTAFLIDPDEHHEIAPGRRLQSVLAIEMHT